MGATAQVPVQVFAANNSSYRHRKRAHRACDQCKRRRKRCLPPFENHERCAGCTKDGLYCSLVAIEPSQGGSSATAGAPASAAEVESEVFTEKLVVLSSDPREGQSGQSRFIGDLNPEAALLSATSKLPPGPSSSSAPALDSGEIGVWVFHEQAAPRSRKRRKSPDCEPSTSAGPTLATHYNNFLESLNAFSRPPRSSVDALLSLYMESVHPIYPLVDTHTINLFKTPDAIPPVLLLSILLVASRHPKAAEHLVLPPTGAPLAPREFASALYTRITALLHAGNEKDRIRLIRVYGLLSLHSADGPHGNEVASMNLCTAIHHAHSAGLHLKRNRSGGRGETELWWCLWELDKLQAAINGRPVLVRGEDTSIDFPSEHEGSGVFRGMVRLAELLEKVIALYRPRKEGGVFQWEEDFPSFEQVVGETNCHDEGLLATLSLFYHAISILSHRTPTSSPHSPSYSRRTASAKAIYEVLSNSTLMHLLPPTSITPYAASLSLTTFYALVREGEKVYLKLYKDTVKVLETLSRWWWFAGAMAALGKEAVGRRGKVECALALSSLREGGEGTMPAAEGQQTLQQQQQQQPQEQHCQHHQQQEQQQQEHPEQIQVPASGVGMPSSTGMTVGMPPTTTAGGPTSGGDWGDMEWGGFPGQLMLDVWDPSNPVDFYDPMFTDGGGMGFNNGGGDVGVGLGAGLGVGLNLGFVMGYPTVRDECLA